MSSALHVTDIASALYRKASGSPLPEVLTKESEGVAFLPQR